MQKKKILIVSFSNLNKDPRVIRQIQALSEDYIIETIGYLPYKDNITHYRIPIDVGNFVLRQIQKIIYFLHGHTLSKSLLLNYLLQSLKEVPSDFNLVICNDLRPLPLAEYFANKSGAILWSDLHEYYPSQLMHSKFKQWMSKSYVEWLCKNYIPLAKYKSVVCKCVGEKYKEVFNIEMDSVITNATAYNENNLPLENQGDIKLVHHGVATPLRELHHMVEMMKYLPSNYVLYFYLVANYNDHKVYLEELKSIAVDQKLSIIFKEPVDTQLLAKELNEYDIGLFILPPVTYNYYCALPNKLYEFIQARLAIAVSPNPEMKSLVEEYGLGIVAPDFSAKGMAEKIMALTREDINKCKLNAHHSAKELSFGTNANLMQQIAKYLLQPEINPLP